jgi:hypothetical protein
MSTLLQGNTYPVKDRLRELGGRWNPRSKGWLIPDENIQAARELVDGANRERSGSRSSGRRYGSYVTRFSSGAEIITNYRGRCEDAPCCGCCS